MPIAKGFSAGLANSLTDYLKNKYKTEDETAAQAAYIAYKSAEDQKDRDLRTGLADYRNQQDERQFKSLFNQRETNAEKAQRAADRAHEIALKRLGIDREQLRATLSKNNREKTPKFTLDQQLLKDRWVQARKEFINASLPDITGRVDVEGMQRWANEFNLIERAMKESGLDPGQSNLGMPERNDSDIMGIGNYFKDKTQIPFRPNINQPAEAAQPGFQQPENISMQNEEIQEQQPIANVETFEPKPFGKDLSIDTSKIDFKNASVFKLQKLAQQTGLKEAEEELIRRKLIYVNPKTGARIIFKDNEWQPF